MKSSKSIVKGSIDSQKDFDKILDLGLSPNNKSGLGFDSDKNLPKKDDGVHDVPPTKVCKIVKNKKIFTRIFGV